METLDQQLDAANARVAEQEAALATAQQRVDELTASLDAANERIAALEQDKTTLETANSELRDNLTAAKDAHAALEVQHGEALAEIAKLKAEAKTAEERAAEIYGARASAAPAAVTPKGDAQQVPVAERFRAITSPTAQTEFLRALSDKERAELFANL